MRLSNILPDNTNISQAKHFRVYPSKNKQSPVDLTRKATPMRNFNDNFSFIASDETTATCSRRLAR